MPIIDDIDHANIISREDLGRFLDYYDSLLCFAENENASQEDIEEAQDLLSDYDPDSIRELRAMYEGTEYGDFISEDYWDEYARDFFDEAYGIPEGAREYVDYKRFADDLTMDYTSWEYDGTTYYSQD